MSTPVPASDPVDAAAAVIRSVPLERTEEVWDPWEDGWISRRVIGRTAEDIARALSDAGWLRTAEDRAEIERLREQATAFANEIVQMHQDRDAYDTALEAQLDEARDGLDERDRIIIERDNEIAQLRAHARRVAAGGTVPADPQAGVETEETPT